MGVPKGGGVRSLLASVGGRGVIGWMEEVLSLYWGQSVDKRLFVLSHAEARRRAMAAVADAPEGYAVTVQPPRRTLDQNSLIHPAIATLAKALGRPTDVESLRQLRYLLLEQWRHETGRPPMFQRSYDGMRWVCVDKGTSDLDKPDCSEFIEFLLAQEAEVTA